MSTTWGQSNTPETLGTVDCGEFFPALDADKFRRLYRIPVELPGEVVLEQLRLGAAAAIASLESWRRGRAEATLAEVPQREIGGTGVLVMFFERACFCLAKAELLRETVTVDRRPQAENAAKSGAETEEKYREFAADALSRICGVPIMEVDLL